MIDPEPSPRTRATPVPGAASRPRGGAGALNANDQAAADYVDRILKGARLGDLPIAQATRFDLVVNLKTARTLGRTIPQAILVRADDVLQ